MIPKKTYSGLIKWILPILIISWFISAAAALEFGKLQWDDGISGTLKRNEIISYAGYSVQVVGFSAPVESEKYKQIPIDPVIPFVGLNISKDGIFFNSTALGQGDSYISYDGEFKVSVVELPPGLSKDWLYESYSPYVKLQLSQRGIPESEISLEADDEYVSAPNTVITLNLKLENTGMADLINVDMDIGTELPLLRGNLKYHYEILKKGEEFNEIVTFSTPVVAELKTYNIYVNSSGFDIKDKLYKSTQIKKIYIAPSSQQAPSLSKNTNAKAYLKDLIMVSISLKNNANYDLKNVSIVDSIPKGFTQVSNNSLKWIVNVPSGGDWYVRYLLKPTEANSNGVLFPATTAELKIQNEYYMIQSNRPETIIYGPRVDLNKQSDVLEINPGDDVTITVVAVNSGSTPTMVKIQDILPSDATLISGTTNLEQYLEANTEIRFSYTFRSNSEGEIRLPPATAEYFELGSKGTKIKTMSKELIISHKLPTPETTPELIDEMPVNYAEEGNIQEIVEPESEIPQPVSEIPQPAPEQPLIEEPGPEPLSVNANAILNLLIGCENISGISSSMTTEVCSFVVNNQYMPGP